MDLKTERVLLHWAIAKIHSNMPGQVIVQSIIEKLATTSSNLSFAAVANEAYRAGREDAAILVLNHLYHGFPFSIIFRIFVLFFAFIHDF